MDSVRKSGVTKGRAHFLCCSSCWNAEGWGLSARQRAGSRWPSPLSPPPSAASCAWKPAVKSCRPYQARTLPGVDDGEKNSAPPLFPHTWLGFRWSCLLQRVAWERLCICLLDMLPPSKESWMLCLGLSSEPMLHFQIPQHCLLPWRRSISRTSLIQANLTSRLVTRVGNHDGNKISGQKWSMKVS